MKERYDVQEVHICPFEFEKTGIRPELEKYPRRLCVFDNERKKVIDINNKLEYDYIETISGLYLINSSIEKIKESKRVAIFPTVTFLSDLDSKTLSKAQAIIKYLESGKKYPDGNTALNNEQYLEKVKEEEKSLKQKLSKVKKIGKIRK
ncbi:MAG: hypothetical protein IJY25_03035 [Bacilli bacterium]|nr:hypothetical protein [Bacilli bacterium]